MIGCNGIAAYRTKNMKYKIAIQVGRNATEILNLPCVRGCNKFDGILVYYLYEWDEYGNELEATQGDWLCEDHKDVWHVLSNEEFVKQKEDGKGNE